MKYHRISTFTGMVLVAAVAITPLAGFAKEHERQGIEKNQPIQKVLSGIGKWFKPENAYAQTLKNKAPAITGIKSPTVLGVNATGTWSINAHDPENGSLSYAVDWGDQAANMLMKAAEPVFTQTSTFTHSFAQAGTYSVKFTVKDEAGLSSSSSVTVRVDGKQSVFTIDGLTATSSRPHTARINWKTAVNTDSAVWYSTSSPVDTTVAPQVVRRGLVKNHVINLEKLEASTTYHVMVRSQDRKGNSVTSSETSFTTPPSKEVSLAPTITSVTGPGSLLTDEEGTWELKASDPKNGSLSYAVDWGDSPTMMRMLSFAAQDQVFVQTSTFTHTYADPGTYTVKFTAKNDAGLTATTSMVVNVTQATSTNDTVAPIVSDIVLAPGESSLSLDWTTDEPASSKVFYSTTTPVDVTGSSTVPFIETESFDTKHSIDIDPATASTTYYLRIVSMDESGNASTSDELSTTTLPKI